MAIEIGKIYKHWKVKERELNKSGNGHHKNDAFWVCECINCGYIRKGKEALRFDYLNENDKHSVICPQCKTKYTIKELPDLKVGAEYNNSEIIDHTCIDVPRRGEIYILKDKITNDIFPRCSTDLKKGFKWHSPRRLPTTESKLATEARNILDKNNIIHKSNMTFYDLRGTNGNALFFDDYCPEYNLMLEYDGKQHYPELATGFYKDQVSDIQLRDNIKEEWCKKHEVNLIRIPWWKEGKITIKDLWPYISDFHIIKYSKCY